MKKWIVPLLAVVALVCLGFWVYLKLFPGDEALIRRKFQTLGKLASVPAEESSLVRIARAKEFASHFARTVRITIRGSNVSDRDEVFQGFLFYRANNPNVSAKALDITVQVDPSGNKASAELTLVWDVEDEKFADVQEFQVDLEKIEDEWLITGVTPVRVLR